MHEMSARQKAERARIACEVGYAFTDYGARTACNKLSELSIDLLGRFTYGFCEPILDSLSRMQINLWNRTQKLNGMLGEPTPEQMHARRCVHGAR